MGCRTLLLSNPSSLHKAFIGSWGMATSIYGCTAATYIFVLVCTSLNAVLARSHHTHLHDLTSPHIHLDRGKASIPHLLHQSWKENQLPSAAHELWRQSWKQQNPSWRIIHWTDEDNRALVENHYPWLLDIYDKLWGVYRADLVGFLTVAFAFSYPCKQLCSCWPWRSDIIVRT